MDVFTIIAFIGYGYLMYTLGKFATRKILDDKIVDAVVAKANVPIGVIEEIEGHYYVYEKDTTKFLGQAATLDELPMKLLENKISLALLMYPERSAAVYWCINGKLKEAYEG